MTRDPRMCFLFEGLAKPEAWPDPAILLLCFLGLWLQGWGLCQGPLLPPPLFCQTRSLGAAAGRPEASCQEELSSRRAGSRQSGVSLGTQA